MIASDSVEMLLRTEYRVVASSKPNHQGQIPSQNGLYLLEPSYVAELSAIAVGSRQSKVPSLSATVLIPAQNWLLSW